jgi:alpha-L-rhamnosidase
MNQSLLSYSSGLATAEPEFSFASPNGGVATTLPALEITPVEPVLFEWRGDHYFVDFGKAAWGNLQFKLDEGISHRLIVRVGERLVAGKIDREPFGSVVYREARLVSTYEPGTYLLDFPRQELHDADMALESAVDLREITIFRYAEIETGGIELDASQLRQLFIHAPFDETAGHFECSNDTLNAVWQMCKHTMKATTAFGIYIDGERERIPYEADAYLNMLSHFACDLDPAVAQATIRHLLDNPTWPTEWSLNTVMMAAAYYEATGDRAVAAHFYEELKPKLFMERTGADGLIRGAANIDWPPMERDNYNNNELLPEDPYKQVGPVLNTFLNALFYHSLKCMEMMATALGHESDADFYREQAMQVYTAFNQRFFDPARKVYIDGTTEDGIASDHVSLHANMLALACGLVPEKHVESVGAYVESRGMACSVYAAQYLLEALFHAGRDKAAVALMTSHEERSWWHMIEEGSTLTWEAWDVKYKPNLTWNHAWGAVPANISTRFVLGVRPLTAGYSQTLIAPQPGGLEWARGKVPTPQGGVEVQYETTNGFRLELIVPEGITARVKWPVTGKCYLQEGEAWDEVAQDGNGLLEGYFVAGRYVLSSQG